LLATSSAAKLLLHAVLALGYSDIAVPVAFVSEREVVLPAADLDARIAFLLASVITNERGTYALEREVRPDRVHGGLIGFLASAIAMIC
jgi:hypothetical protein